MTVEMSETKATAPTGWSYLSNHTYVLLCLNRDPQMRLREVAASVGITERAVQRIVAELEADGVLARARVGRRNTYATTLKSSLRHPLVESLTVGDLMRTLQA